MPDYFKNLSAFRLLLICLLAVSGAIGLFGVLAGGHANRKDGARNQALGNAVRLCSEEFGRRLTGLETVAVDLAVHYERLGSARDPEKVGRLLTATLETSPDYLIGAGVTVYGAENEPRQVSYVAKSHQHPPEELDTILQEKRGDGDLLAREVNIDRHIQWILLATPPADKDRRFSVLLSVSLGAFQASTGAAMLKADLDWLEDLLRRLKAAGAATPVCVTPDRDALWLENGRLVFDKEFQRESLRAEHEPVLRAIAAVDADGERGIIKSDILGTGWFLVVPDPGRPASESRPLSLVTVIMLAAGGLFLLDALVFSLAAPHNGADSQEENPSARQAGTPGLLNGVYNLLFRYRMVNPDKTRMESEMRIARKIQFSLVPDIFPKYSEWREFDLYSILSPAREVGGDYYDFFMLDSDRLLLTVGDVSGKGFPAALYMAVCRTAFRTIAREADDPGEILTRLNDLLVRDNKSGFYITMVTFIVDLPTGDCEYAIAAHPAPLWHEPITGSAIFVDNPRETFIGMKAGLTYPTGKFRLHPGDTLLLYSDGATEAANPAREELEYAGLQRIFLDAVGADRCREVIEKMETSIHEFMESREGQDDLTLLAFRYWGRGGQKMLRKQNRKKKEGEADGA